MGLRSALAVASIAGDRLVGVLTFYSSQDEPFSDTHCRAGRGGGFGPRRLSAGGRHASAIIAVPARRAARHDG